jgi:hypothetical protein
MSLFAALRDRRHMWRALHATPSLVANAATGRVAKIQGYVEADEELVSPITGRPCVAWEARVDNLDRPLGLELESALGDRVPFWIVDAAGDRARIDVGPVILRMVLENVSKHYKVTDDNEVLRAFLVARKVRTGVDDHLFWEALLRPGDLVWAYGVVDGTPGIERSGYRDGSQPHCSVQGTPDDPLVLYRLGPAPTSEKR